MRPWRGRRRGPCLPPAQADCNCGSIDFCALACGSTPQAHGAYSSGPISPNLASRARVRGQQNPWSMHRSCRPLPSKPPPRPRPPTGSQRGEPTADPKSGAPGRRPWRGRRRGPCLPPARADWNCVSGVGGARRFLRAGARAHIPSAWLPPQRPPFPTSRDAGSSSWAVEPVEYAPPLPSPPHPTRPPPRPRRPAGAGARRTHRRSKAWSAGKAPLARASPRALPPSGPS